MVNCRAVQLVRSAMFSKPSRVITKSVIKFISLHFYPEHV